jgi:hypothetical protein
VPAGVDVDLSCTRRTRPARCCGPKMTRYIAPGDPPAGLGIRRFTGQAAARAWFRAEQHVLPQVLAWAFDRELDHQVVQLRFCLDSYDRTQNLPAANNVVLAAAQRLGGDLELSGRVDQVITTTQTAIGISRETGDRHGTAIGLYNLRSWSRTVRAQGPGLRPARCRPIWPWRRDGSAQGQIRSAERSAGNFRPPSLAGRGRTIRRNSRPGPSMSPQRACPQVSAAALARCF